MEVAQTSTTTFWSYWNESLLRHAAVNAPRPPAGFSKWEFSSWPANCWPSSMLSPRLRYTWSSYGKGVHERQGSVPLIWPERDVLPALSCLLRNCADGLQRIKALPYQWSASPTFSHPQDQPAYGDLWQFYMVMRRIVAHILLEIGPLKRSWCTATVLWPVQENSGAR